MSRIALLSSLAMKFENEKLEGFFGTAAKYEASTESFNDPQPHVIIRHLRSLDCISLLKRDIVYHKPSRSYAKRKHQRKVQIEKEAS